MRCVACLVLVRVQCPEISLSVTLVQLVVVSRDYPASEGWTIIVWLQLAWQIAILQFIIRFQMPRAVVFHEFSLFVVAWPSVTTDHCAMIEEENKRSAPAVPSSKLQHVKRFVLEDECARCFGQIDCIVAVENDHK
ncbi:hypothetical protein T4A_10607 [Trichinella pseudospiralis]|uniref:Uncharacterized protein n=1 Tax=Trichinella pseudospiralis TaxID=6337 RepID=A0A0V1E5E1_TRIPS|nr:hypothetical protein T4A_10607 [Trichinella pseudospiralis]